MNTIIQESWIYFKQHYYELVERADTVTLLNNFVHKIPILDIQN